MPCVNHPEAAVQSYCQSCGKPLCTSCVRTTAAGQVFCEQCQATSGVDPSQAYWQAYVTPPRGVPNPAAAAVLGLIPGVGAMYNGQLFKGLIHVVIFAVLVSITENYGVFGIFIGAWVLYQSFEAFHTAKARRDGLPVPDPFGLNELGSWLNLSGWGGFRGHGDPQGQNAPPPAAGGAGPVTPGAEQTPPPYSAPYTSSWSGTGGGAVPPSYTEPYAGPYAGANPEGYPGNYPPGNYPPGGYPPGYIPPIPPDPMGMPPFGWRRKEPVWAVVLIVLGVIFLLRSLGFIGHFMHFVWPLLLIGFGAWLIVRRVGPFQGGPK